jgi:DNA-binding YbaB/EbfC family protein
MFQGLSNLANLFRQAQQLGGRMQEVQQRLKARRASGSAGGGMVEVEVNGLGEVLRVKIDPALVARNELEMIEQLSAAAFNQAQAKARELHAEAMQNMAEGMNLPGLQEAIAQFTNGPGKE